MYDCFNQLLKSLCKLFEALPPSKYDIKSLHTCLMNEISSNDNAGYYCRKLDKRKSYEDILKYLVSCGLVGYLNYELLKKFNDIPNVRSLIDEYEEQYIQLIEISDYRTLMEVLTRNPKFKPKFLIGLPTFTLRMETKAARIKVCYWNNLFEKKFRWKKFICIQKISKHCIIIEYSVLPIAASSVVRDLTDTTVLEMLKENGISDIKLSPELLFIGRRGKMYYYVYNIELFFK